MPDLIDLVWQDRHGGKEAEGKKGVMRVEMYILVVVKWGMLGDMNMYEVYDGGGNQNGY